MDRDGEATANRESKRPALRALFMHADAVDVALMFLGVLGAMGDGMALPAVRLLVYTRIADDIGRGPDVVQQFSSRINAVSIYQSVKTCIAVACCYQTIITNPVHVDGWIRTRGT